MRTRNIINGIGRFFVVMDSAIAVSNAVRERRPVRDADLVKLGIDPERFRTVDYR